MENLTLKDIQNYFGDRGMEFHTKYVKNWGYDDKYLYFIPNREYPDTCVSSTFYNDEFIKGVRADTTDTVLWISRKCPWGEIEDEVLLSESPYKFEEAK